MSSKKVSNVTSTREAASAAVAKWRSLTADAEAKQAAVREFEAAYPLPKGTYQYGNRIKSSPVLLEQLRRQIIVEEALEKASIAEREAAICLDAAERADGDEDSRTRDAHLLREDLLEYEAEIARAQAALQAAQRRPMERVQAALRAQATVKARRAANGEPFTSIGVTFVFGRSCLQAVDEAIARGVPMPNFEERHKQLRAHLTKVASDLEEQRLEEQAAAEDAEKLRVHKQREAEREWANERAKEKAQREEIEGERRRRDELAAAHLARLGAVS